MATVGELQDREERVYLATLMFFLGLFVLGWIAWNRIPVELLPPISGEELFVSFNRPGS